MDGLDSVISGLETTQPGYGQQQEHDYTNAYNTPLDTKQEAEFQKWVQDRSKTRDVSKDLYDYDLRGAFKSGAATAGNGHLPDTYKKPNHPTFSDESMYNGVNGNVGGKWVDKGDDKWQFQAGQTNLQLHSPEQLQQYFKEAEPDVELVMPVVAP